MQSEVKTWSTKEVAQWIRSHGQIFEAIADEFLRNGVEGEDLVDEVVFSKPIYDDMLQACASPLFAKNKLWKKIKGLKNSVPETKPQFHASAWDKHSLSVNPFAPDEETQKERGRGSSIFSKDSFNASPIVPPSSYQLMEKPLTEPKLVLKNDERRMSYAERLRETSSQEPGFTLATAGLLSAKPGRPKPHVKAKPARAPLDVAKHTFAKENHRRTKMMLWRGYDAASSFQPEVLESFLENEFDVTFRYQYNTQRFSLYGSEECVRKALKVVEEQNLNHEDLFDHLYDIDSLELHVSPRDCRTLDQNEKLNAFIKANDAHIFHEATDMTKPNGEKKRRLLMSGAQMPELAALVASILFRDFSKVYTNYIFTTEIEKFDEIMVNAPEPYWRTVARDTDTTVRVLNKLGRRHVLVSGKVCNVLKAKERLELRLNQV